MKPGTSELFGNKVIRLVHILAADVFCCQGYKQDISEMKETIIHMLWKYEHIKTEITTRFKMCTYKILFWFGWRESLNSLT